MSIRRVFLRNSLAARLVLSAMAVALVLLVIAGGLLHYLFKTTVERNFDARLEAVMNGLLASVEVDAQGRPYVRGQLADARFQLPASGWYWQIMPEDGQGQSLASKSLLEQRFDPALFKDAPRDENGVAHLFVRDVNGARLRLMEQGYTLYGGKKRYAIIVAGNYDELRTEISAFNRAMIVILALFALALVMALVAQVHFGLRPLRRLHDELGEIREGRREQLDEKYPAEIEPVAHELNLLLRANREIVDRARTQVGNLAHALKTPLSVLTNEARAAKGRLAGHVLQQTRMMRDQINIYLDRARRAARATGPGAVTPVEDVVKALVRTLKRINRDRDMKVEVLCPGGIRFRGERQDLEEIIGNLLDNAFKYARTRIRLRGELEDGGRHQRRWLVLTIEDDGPGLPRKDHEKALKRGQRLDETRPGSGLGLSIVHETAVMYHGEITLGRSPLGGLKATLRLPAART